MAKNEPFNSSNQGAAGSGLRTNRVEGASRMHKPYFKLGVEANNAEPGRFHQTAIETSRNEFPVETTAAVTVPLHIVSSRPPYIPAPANAPAEGVMRCYIEWGTLNEKLASNWDAYYDVSATTFFFAKATLRTTETLLVFSWEIVTGSAYNSHATADWLAGAPRPAEAVCLLGSVVFEGGKFLSVVNSGGGSLTLTEHLTEVLPGPNGVTIIGKQLTFLRNTY